MRGKVKVCHLHSSVPTQLRVSWRSCASERAEGPLLAALEARTPHTRGERGHSEVWHQTGLLPGTGITSPLGGLTSSCLCWWNYLSLKGFCIFFLSCVTERPSFYFHLSLSPEHLTSSRCSAILKQMNHEQICSSREELGAKVYPG